MKRDGQTGHQPKWDRFSPIRSNLNDNRSREKSGGSHLISGLCYCTVPILSSLKRVQVLQQKCGVRIPRNESNDTPYDVQKIQHILEHSAGAEYDEAGIPVPASPIHDTRDTAGGRMLNTTEYSVLLTSTKQVPSTPYGIDNK